MHEKLFTTLHQEHEEVKNILRQLKESNGEKRDQLFSQLKHLLIPHMRGEESEFYPILSNKRETHMLALHAVEEHHAARLLLNELDETRQDTDQWRAKLGVFYDVLVHHIETEENKVFEATRQNFSHEEIENMLSKYQRVEERELSLL
jgi:hemerythrin-like domain-containing protein